MAINLVARMTLRDNLTGPMRRATRQMNETERATTRLSRRMNQNNSLFSRFGRTTSGLVSGVGGLAKGFGGLLSKLNPVALGFGAIGAAAASAYGAVKIFNATVGEAMKMQQSQVVISAMFDDKKVSDQYMKMIDKIAINSPLLDSQAMYGNSKTFITASKDLGQLEKMWNLAERLVASDPQQGLEGAIYALRELFSGDAISIVDRFEMPKKVMNEIKKLPLDKQLSKLDEYFNKIGMTSKLIDDMGGSALGMWQQVKERMQLTLRDMGEPSLKAVSKFLGGVLDRFEGEDMKKFSDWGGRIIERMVSGLSNNAIKLYDWFAGLMNDPEFQSKSTLTAKVQFVVNDIAERLQAWYDGGGKDKIINFAKGVTEVMVGALDNSPAFLELGGKLGVAIWQGIEGGIKSSAKSSKLGALLSLGNMSWDVVSNPNTTSKAIGAFTRTTKKLKENRIGSNGKFGPQKSHSGGLDRVPYTGYQPVLHKDEKVLTAQQAREYREGKGGSGGITITGNTFNVRDDLDVKKIAMELARYIESEGGQMAT
ncbi:hypothetical protein [Psychrobacillus sp. FSL K6-1267]|uniref:hypothetical protein n=1 Tax=Psychrobacillus sp. FSL K6-1267 TaxID=2921543 RepID=UPI0030F8E5C2